MPRYISLMLLAVMLIAAPCLAAGVEVGDKAPSFEGLVGVDDKPHSLAEFKDAPVIVLTFTCNRCPVAVAYEDRFAKFTKEYAEKGVRFIAINVSSAEDLTAMKVRAEERGFNFPYLRDEAQTVAREYGATVTPHVYVLSGPERTVSYVGAFDDNMSAPTEHFVRDAVDALLAGKEVAKTSSRAFGCGIEWKR